MLTAMKKRRFIVLGLAEGLGGLPMPTGDFEHLVDAIEYGWHLDDPYPGVRMSHRIVGWYIWDTQEHHVCHMAIRNPDTEPLAWNEVSARSGCEE